MSPPPSAPRPTLLKTGQHLAGYEVLGLLGRGGMGEVYRARQVSMDRLVALKVLVPRLAKDPAFTARFIAEARAAGKLNHANIVHVHDVGNTTLPNGQEVHYFSMELVDGESVQDILDREQRLDPARLGPVMVGTAEALAYAASLGIVHRDVKPDNILLTRDGRAKLADLGLATFAGDGPTERDEKGRVKVMGTPRYMAPEQARGLTVDHRCDQYSLGATLYHLITGAPPYDGTDGKTVMHAHVHDPIPDPHDLDPTIPEAWRQLSLRLMAKEPEERLSTATELVEAVTAAAQGVTLTTLERRKRGLPWAAILAVTAGLGGLGLLLMMLLGTSPRRVTTTVVSTPPTTVTAAPTPTPVTTPPEAPAVTVAPPVQTTAPVPAPTTPPEAPPVTAAPESPWTELARNLDGDRDSLAYLKTKPTVHRALIALRNTPKVALAIQLRTLGTYGQDGEAALRSYVMSESPVVTLADDRIITATRLTMTHLHGRLTDGTTVEIPRQHALKSWEDLLHSAITYQGLTPAPAIHAACLWWWRDSATTRVLAKGTDPFLVALRDLDAAIPR